MLSSIWQYVSGALLGVLIMLGTYTYFVKGALNDALDDNTRVRLELALKTTAFDAQSAIIESQRVDLNKSMDKLDKWKALPPEIRYETIYKRIPGWVEIKRSNCDDVKAILNSFNDTTI